MTRALIFDVGDVLIRWDARRVYPELTAAELDAFFDEVGFHAWNLEQDRGRGWDAAVAELSARHPHRAALIARFHRRWHDSVPGVVEGMPQLIDRLHEAGAPLYAITNFSAEKWRESAARFPFLRERFRDVTVSAHEGVTKPDPAIYRRCLDRNGLAAADCLFVDDSPANVEGARAVGMEAVHFTGAAPLIAALRERGWPA